MQMITINISMLVFPACYPWTPHQKCGKFTRICRGLGNMRKGGWNLLVCIFCAYYCWFSRSFECRPCVCCFCVHLRFSNAQVSTHVSVIYVYWVHFVRQIRVRPGLLRVCCALVVTLFRSENAGAGAVHLDLEVVALTTLGYYQGCENSV